MRQRSEPLLISSENKEKFFKKKQRLVKTGEINFLVLMRTLLDFQWLEHGFQLGSFLLKTMRIGRNKTCIRLHVACQATLVMSFQALPRGKMLVSKVYFIYFFLIFKRRTSGRCSQQRMITAEPQIRLEWLWVGIVNYTAKTESCSKPFEFNLNVAVISGWKISGHLSFNFFIFFKEMKEREREAPITTT